MTTVPLHGPNATVAQMLAAVRREDIPASDQALSPFIARPPQGDPATGQYLGMVHIQRCASPADLLGTILTATSSPWTPTRTSRP